MPAAERASSEQGRVFQEGKLTKTEVRVTHKFVTHTSTGLVVTHTHLILPARAFPIVLFVFLEAVLPS